MKPNDYLLILYERRGEKKERNKKHILLVVIKTNDDDFGLNQFRVSKGHAMTGRRHPCYSKVMNMSIYGICKFLNKFNELIEIFIKKFT